MQYRKKSHTKFKLNTINNDVPLGREREREEEKETHRRRCRARCGDWWERDIRTMAIIPNQNPWIITCMQLHKPLLATMFCAMVAWIWPWKHDIISARSSSRIQQRRIQGEPRGRGLLSGIKHNKNKRDQKEREHHARGHPSCAKLAMQAWYRGERRGVGGEGRRLFHQGVEV